MIFIGPSFNASIEGWIAYGYWDVQLREDGEVVVVAPWKKHYADASETEFLIDEFTAEVKEAHEQRQEAFDGRVGAEENLHNVLRSIYQIDSVYRHYNLYEDAIATPAPPPPAMGQDHPFPDPQLIGWVYANRGAKQ